MNKTFKTFMLLGLAIVLCGLPLQAASAETGAAPADPGHFYIGADSGPKWFEGMDFEYGANPGTTSGGGIAFDTGGAGGAVEVSAGYVLPENWSPEILGKNLRLETSWNYSRNESKGSHVVSAGLGLAPINGQNPFGAQVFTLFDTDNTYESKERYWGMDFLIQSDYSLLDEEVLTLSPYTGVTFTNRRSKITLDNRTVGTGFHNMQLSEAVDTWYIGWKFGGTLTYQPIENLTLVGNASLAILGAASDLSATQDYKATGLGAFYVDDSDSRVTLVGNFGLGVYYDLMGWATIYTRGEVEVWDGVSKAVNPTLDTDPAVHLGEQNVTNFALTFGITIPLGHAPEEEEVV